jgi:hypothetical protein
LKRFITILAAVGIAGPLASHLAAQGRSAEADIPFAFVVSDRTLPAGHYTISQTFVGGAVFSVNDGNHFSSSVMLSNLEVDKAESPRLSFACDGKVCVLAKVRAPGSDMSYALVPLALQKALPRSLGISSMISVQLSPR